MYLLHVRALLRMPGHLPVFLSWDQQATTVTVASLPSQQHAPVKTLQTLWHPTQPHSSPLPVHLVSATARSSFFNSRKTSHTSRSQTVHHFSATYRANIRGFLILLLLISIDNHLFPTPSRKTRTSTLNDIYMHSRRMRRTLNSPIHKTQV